MRIGSIGDTLVAIPSIRLIKANYLNSTVTLLTNKPINGGIKAVSSYKILDGSGLIDNYIEYDNSNIIKLIKDIRNLKPDYIYYLMPPRNIIQRIRDGIFFALVNKFHIIGLYLVDYKKVYSYKKNGELYESEASRLVRSIGYDSEKLNDSLFEIGLNQEDRLKTELKIKKYNINEKYIVISIGTKIQVNDWGSKNWIELIRIIRPYVKNYILIMIGSKDEFLESENIIKHWPNAGINLCGETTPRESASVLAMASLYIGHDSGPMHLASSVGIKVIGIFSSRNRKGIWYPYSNEKNIFYTDIPCSGCELSICIENQKKCINSIEPKDVAEKIIDLLNK